MKKTIYAIHSTVLNKTVFISGKEAAEKFATEQTEHTGRDHVAEPVELHEDAGKLNAAIDEVTKAALLQRMTPGERRAFGIAETKPVPAVPIPADEEV